MTQPSGPALALLSPTVAVFIAIALVYLNRVRVPRPPIGTYRWRDIAIMAVFVVLAPLGYSAMPRVAVGTIFGLVIGMAIQFTLAPLLGGRFGTVAAIVLCAATATAAILGRPILVTVLTDIALAVAVVGVTNLWVQSGMRASHVAGFAAMLCAYDLVATALTDMTAQFAKEVAGLPFAPVFALTDGPAGVSIGLGDLLLLLLFPLAATKAFGRLAGMVAAALGVAVTAVVALLFWLGTLTTAVPLLTVLGPLIVAEYMLWRRVGLRERTVEQWHRGWPSTAPDGDPLGAIRSALGVDVAGFDPGTWIAVDGARVVGVGGSAGTARRAAREAGHCGVPLVRQA